jgi:hypothetical protein
MAADEAVLNKEKKFKKPVFNNTGSAASACNVMDPRHCS